MQRILLELLNQMDGFDQSVNVKVKMCNSQSEAYKLLFNSMQLNSRNMHAF